MRIKAGDKPIGLAYPLSKVKEYLRVTGTDQDAVISQLINSAVDIIEHETWIVLHSRSFTMYMDDFTMLTNGRLAPSALIAKYPVTAISSVKYYDTSNSLQTMSASDYSTDIQSNLTRIYFENTYNVYNDRFNAVEIAFTAGYADWHDIPDQYVQCLLALVHELYDGRQEETITIADRLMKNVSKRTPL